MNDATLSFALTKAEQPVEIDQEPYVLIELDGAGRDKYLNDLGGRLKTNVQGNAAGLKSFDRLQANLVAACLFKLDGDAYEPVKVTTIQAWPAKVVSGLFDAAKELSGLGDDDEEEKEGND